MRTLSKQTHDPLLYYAKLCYGMTNTTQSQLESLERQFLRESKKDVIDSIELDKYFTRLLVLCEDILDECRVLSNMILERE